MKIAAHFGGFIKLSSVAILNRRKSVLGIANIEYVSFLEEVYFELGDVGGGGYCLTVGVSV